MYLHTLEQTSSTTTIIMQKPVASPVLTVLIECLTVLLEYIHFLLPLTGHIKHLAVYTPVYTNPSTN